MGKSRTRDYLDEPRVKQVRKGIDKSNKHRKAIYDYRYLSKYSDDDFDDEEYY